MFLHKRRERWSSPPETWHCILRILRLSVSAGESWAEMLPGRLASRRAVRSSPFGLSQNLKPPRDLTRDRPVSRPEEGKIKGRETHPTAGQQAAIP